MGCCENKGKKSHLSQILKQNEYFDKENQEKQLYDILSQIDLEIQLIKQGVFNSI